MASAGVDRYDLARLNRVANDLAGVCRKSVAQIVEGQVKGFLYVAVKATPIAPEYVVNEGFYSANGTFYPWPKPRKVKVVGRGFARSGWAKAQADMGMRGAGTYVTGRRQGTRYGALVRSDRRDDMGITVANSIPYIHALDPAEIIRKGIKYATIRGEMAMRAIAKRDIRRAWRRYN